MTLNDGCWFRLDPVTYLSIFHSVFLQILCFRASINSGWWCVNAGASVTRPFVISFERETRVYIALLRAERKENGDGRRREKSDAGEEERRRRSCVASGQPAEFHRYFSCHFL